MCYVLPYVNHVRRQYCSRRLRSLYKAVKFLHGKGRYQKKKLDVPQVTDVR